MAKAFLEGDLAATQAAATTEAEAADSDEDMDGL